MTMVTSLLYSFNVSILCRLNILIIECLNFYNFLKSVRNCNFVMQRKTNEGHLKPFYLMRYGIYCLFNRGKKLEQQGFCY